MRYRNLLPLMLAFSVSAFNSEAQLYNNGASIQIQPGASIFVAGEVQNNAGGTISNDGKLEVQGNFTNNAVYNSTTADDSLILSGTGNVLVNAGTAVINYLTISKSTNANTVTLVSTLSLGKKLDYTSGSFSTDPINNPSYLFTAPVSAVFNYAADREIYGKVRRTGWANGSAVVFNQANMLVTTNAGTAPADLTVTMLPNGDPTQSERELKRKFQFAQTGGSNFTADIRFPYQDAELNTNAEPTLVPWQLVSSEWNGKLTPVTRDGAVNYVATTGITASEFLNEWKLADANYTFNATAFLKGAWNGVSAMTTTLNTGGIIPLNQPYNVSPFNYAGTESVGSIPNANVVDWVLVELRKPSSSLPEDALAGTIIGSKAGFLLANGSIVNTDGSTPISFNISKQGGAFVVVRHRNHLGLISYLVPSNAAGTFTNDFTVLANSYKPTGASSDPVSLLAGGVKYGMWSGDANKNGIVNVTDINVIKQAIAASASGYQLTDVNMSNSINVTDVNVTKSTVGNSGQGSGSKTAIITTNIPDTLNITE